MDISYIIYLIAIITFISWILFAILGGIGLAAIPLDFFFDFCTRPKNMRSMEVRQRKEELIKNLEELQELGEKVSQCEIKGDHKRFALSKPRRSYNSKLKEFKQMYLEAEEEYQILNIAEEMKKDGNCVILLYYLLIPLGIVTACFTILWLIQFICTYIYMKKDRTPGYPFLSNMFIFFQDHDVGFLSFFFFSLFCLYLLWATIKGNIKFGGRIFCCVSIHPMKKDGTYMNSFLFNIMLVLLCSFSIVQFCSASFTDYVTFTDIDIIFNVQIKYLKFFSIFYKYYIFEYLLLASFIISLFALTCCRKYTRTTATSK
ncbi:MAG: LMBR1 domain-containing protein, partial [archaeon]|nr:LMBR1 domain-containing protein [archaeon]